MHIDATTPSRTERDELTRPSDVLRVTPPVDVYENQEEILLVGDFPGVDPDALDVRLDGQDLTIRARVTSVDPEEPPRELHRAFRVPRTIDPANVTAELRDGVLTLKLRKRAEVRPRRIEVRAL